MKYYSRLPAATGGNVFFNGAQRCSKEQNYRQVEAPVQVELVEEGGKYYLKTNLYEHLPEFATDFISSDVLGEAFEPEQRFENPDAATSPIKSTTYWPSQASSGVPSMCGQAASTRK